MSHSIVQVTAADGGQFNAYLSTPDALPPQGAGVVVVLQEIFGVNANVRGIADDFAAQGYYAIAPDIFWRQEPGVDLDPASPEAREAATALLKGLDVERAVDDAAATLAFARGLPGASQAAAAVGYCLGGKLAYLLAARGDLDAAVSYYGVGIQGELDRIPQLKGKVLLHIAGEDHLCPVDAQIRIEAAMAALGERGQVINHPGVGHAFARRGGAGFDAKAAGTADRATAILLAEALS